MDSSMLDANLHPQFLNGWAHVHWGASRLQLVETPRPWQSSHLWKRGVFPCALIVGVSNVPNVHWEMTKQGLTDTTIKQHNETTVCPPATYVRYLPAGSNFRGGRSRVAFSLQLLHFSNIPKKRPQEYSSAVKMADKGTAMYPIHTGSLKRKLVN